MENTNYYIERNHKGNEKLKITLKELPEFCMEFFVGKANSTSILTRLSYAQDYLIFFQFLSENIPSFYGKAVNSYTLEDLNKITSTHIESYLNFLSSYERNGDIYSNELVTKARKLASVRALFLYFYRKNLLRENVTQKVANPKIPRKDIIRLNNDEVSNILNVAEKGNGLTVRQQSYNKITGRRDVAILSLFLGTGIRISELVGLNIEDIDFRVNAFTITRKGGNRAILYFNEEVSGALQEYLEERKLKEKDKFPISSAFFISIQNKRIGVRAVEKLVQKYAKIVSPLKPITPHKLRSTFGTNLYRATKDIYVVAEVLGHKDVNTTKKHYAAISEDIKREASTKVKLR